MPRRFISAEEIAALEPYVETETERQVLDLCLSIGSYPEIAEKLGITRTAPHKTVQRIRQRAAAQGVSYEGGMTRHVPEPFVAKGHSTLDKIDPETGERTQLLQWTKTSLDHERRALAIRKGIAALCDGIPKAQPVPMPAASDSDLCTTYIVTDYHVGAYAWKPESGADWDLAIAERTLDACFQGMVDRSPPARTAIIAQLGDFLDYDSLTPVTPTNKHILDVDGRYAKVVSVAVRCVVRMIDQALAKHEEVKLLLAEGNHDLSSSVWLREMFGRMYADNPRVRLIRSESPYYAYKFGKVLIGFHHGHMTKKDNLPMLFAQRYRPMWGQTEHCEVHVGHMHHHDAKDRGMVRVIQHPTLAAANAHSARAGYDAPREASAITYHRRFGRWQTNYITPEMCEVA